MTVALSGRRVLVTGAAGFLGSHLCAAAELRGARVYAVSRREPPANSDARIWLRADCADAEALRAVLRTVRPEVIFHLVGAGRGDPDLSTVLPTIHGDLLPCLTMLAVASEIGFDRMVLAGSLEEPMAAAPGPVASPYAVAKWCSSVYAAMFHDLFRAPVTLVRPYMTYGPRQRPFKLVPSVILSILEGRAPELGSGTRPVDWIYVDDVIEGMLAAGERPGIEGRTLDLGTGVAVTIREVVETIARLMDVPIQPTFGALPERPSEVVRVADVSVSEAILGWKARTPLEEGLRRTIAWYRSSGGRGE